MDSSHGLGVTSVSYLWYLFCIATAAGWVFVDARGRHANRYWIAGVLIAGPLGLAAYFALRPLREGESREGGVAWQFLSRVVVWWTALLALAVVWNAALSFVPMTTLGIAWGSVAFPALVMGLALKRNTTEHGPTGALAVLAMWFSGPERTADGHAYICRECGKEYSVDLPFCDGCGAWPGQSG